MRLFSSYGRLPVSFPCHGGQIPLYDNRKNTSRPTLTRSPHHPTRGRNLLQRRTRHPLFPFGFGLGYRASTLENLQIAEEDIPLDGTLSVCVTVRNTGGCEAGRRCTSTSTTMLGRVTRPIQELEGVARRGAGAGGGARGRLRASGGGIRVDDSLNGVEGRSRCF